MGPKVKTEGGMPDRLLSKAIKYLPTRVSVCVCVSVRETLSHCIESEIRLGWELISQ